MHLTQETAVNSGSNFGTDIVLDVDEGNQTILKKQPLSWPLLWRMARSQGDQS